MKKYIIPILLLTAICSTLLAQVDRSKAPEPAPAPKIHFGNATKFELPNGLKVFVVENHRIPRISYSITSIFAPPLEKGHVGIGDLTSDLIGTGTRIRTKDQIDSSIDFMGASLSASPTGIYASSLTKHTENLLKVFSDVAMNSVFTKKELKKKKTQLLSELASEKDDPNVIAENVFSALIYGKNHPYGEFETEQSVKSVTLDMCTDYYRKYFIPNISYLVIIGDITPARAKQLANKYFATWPKGKPVHESYPMPEAPQKRVVAMVDRPQSVQSIINIGYPIDLNVSNPDFIKTEVTNTVLGGGEFRLFNDLREKHGFTYGAYSGLYIHPLISSFKAYTSVRNAVTDSSITQILYEMKRMRDEPVTQKELKLVKNYMTGNFALSLERPQTIASFAVNTERYHLPIDFYANYLKNIAAVNVKDVQTMAKKYITPDRSVILVVGKSSVLKDKLKKFSPTSQVEMLDHNADPVDTSSKVIPTGITAQKVFDRYIEVIGGVGNLGKIKDLHIKATLNIKGRTLNLDLAYKLPEKFASEVLMNGRVFQKQVLNGDSASVSGMQGKQSVKGAELEQLKINAQPFPELYYAKHGYTAKVTDVTKVNGEKAYKVEITSPMGNTSTDYYSVATGLKVRTESTLESKMGKIPQTTDYSEYTEVNGIKFPKKMEQQVGGQSFDVNVDSIDINSGIPDQMFN